MHGISSAGRRGSFEKAPEIRFRDEAHGSLNNSKKTLDINKSFAKNS
jgi:hypothetical protein